MSMEPIIAQPHNVIVRQVTTETFVEVVIGVTFILHIMELMEQLMKSLERVLNVMRVRIILLRPLN